MLTLTQFSKLLLLRLRPYPTMVTCVHGSKVTTRPFAIPLVANPVIILIDKRLKSLDALGEDLFAMLLPKEGIAEVKAALREQGHIRSRPSRIVVGEDNEEVFLEVTIVKTPDAPGRGHAFMALIRDVTARMRQEDRGP